MILAIKKLVEPVRNMPVRRWSCDVARIFFHLWVGFRKLCGNPAAELPEG